MKSFVDLVNTKIKNQRLSIRKVAKEIGIDASFFSKVLSSKRSPPTEEKVLRKLAKLLDVDPLLLIISTGTIPMELQPMMESPEFLKTIHEKLSNNHDLKWTSSQTASDFVQKNAERTIPSRKKKRIRMEPTSSQLSEDLL